MSRGAYIEALNESSETLPVVTEEGKVIGKALRSECHSGSHLLHPVVHLHLINSEGDIFMQKRPSFKKIQPDRWDTSVGGHISYGEDINLSLKREVFEELGVEQFSAHKIAMYRWDSTVESELINSYLSREFSSINIPTDEVEEGKFWSINTIDSIIEESSQSIFTPNFVFEYINHLRPYLKGE